MSGCFQRSFAALMWRNHLYRKRKFVSSALEILLPLLSIVLLILLQNAGGGNVAKGITSGIQSVKLPSNEQTIIPLSFSDYIVGLESEKKCVNAGLKNLKYLTTFGISGIEGDWSNPFVSCDARQCEYVGQDANQAIHYEEGDEGVGGFCEYKMLALAPRNQKTEAFREWIYSQHEVLRPSFNSTSSSSSSLPFEFEFVQIFDTETELNDYIKDPLYGTTPKPKIGGALILSSSSNNDKDYNYTIRVNSTNYNKPEEARRPAAPTHPNTYKVLDTYAKSPEDVCLLQPVTSYLGKWNTYCTGQYMYNGAITLQRLIQDWILQDAISVNNNNNTSSSSSIIRVAENGVSFGTYPKKHNLSSDQEGFSSISDFVPLFIILGLMFPFSQMIRHICTEKELKQKEVMQMMSVPEIAIETSWFTTFFIFWLIPTCVLVSFISQEFLFVNSSLMYITFFWFMTFLSIISFALFISSSSLGTSTSTTRTTLAGILLFFIGYFLSVFLDFRNNSPIFNYILNLHPITSLGYGLQLIGELEDTGTGLVDYATLMYSDNASQYSLKTCLTFLSIDALLWGIMSLYLNRVSAGYGGGQRIAFPLMKKYWFPNSTRDSTTTTMHSHHHPSPLSLPQVIEPVSDILKEQTKEGKSIEIRNLTKHFDNGKKRAVHNLNLTMYSGQITALLGKNGAGKTTTIGMLTGMISPSSSKGGSEGGGGGGATICGNDLNTQISSIRENLGICLQHDDCLFPLLTVKEHIQFYQQIKGSSLSSSSSQHNHNDATEKEKEEGEDSITKSMKDVALYDKRNTYAKNLSGGMKRKLSVAIAFSGDSKVVFLDEPTSGMDPFSRRFTWDVIRKYKQNRIIILTTHFMEEADLLGDRIAVMAQGELKCVASPLYLKKVYGVGYQLTIEKKPGNSSDTKIDEAIHATIHESVGIDDDDEGGAKLLSNIGTEVIYQLPLQSSPKFQNMFSKLDEMVDTQQIVTYGISITTLDEVFLMIAKGEKDNGRKKILQKEEEEGKEGMDHDNMISTTTTDTKIPSNSNSNDVESLSFTTKQKQSPSTTREVSMAIPINDDVDDESTLMRPSSSSCVLDDNNKEINKTATTKTTTTTKNTTKQHIQALMLKRAHNFKRDKKAWLCSIVLPSIATLVGFLAIEVIAPVREMPALTLTFDDYNTDLSSSSSSSTIRNPITYNDERLAFDCNPGVCLMQEDSYNIESTGETYHYCGASTGLVSSNQFKCTVSQIEDIANQMNDPEKGVSVVRDEYSTSVFEVSQTLLNSPSVEFEATKYGSIYFNRDMTSQILDEENSSSSSFYDYKDIAVENCKLKRGSYRSEKQCEHFDGISYVVITNFTSIHAPLLYQAAADEAILNSAIQNNNENENENNNNVSISVTIHPLPLTHKEEGFTSAEDSLLTWFVLIFSFPFITGTFASFIVSEKTSKAKHLQVISGVKPTAYWLSSFFWDLLNYQLPLWIVLSLMYILDITVFTTEERDANLGTFAALILFGPAAIGFTYCVTFFFENPSACNFVVICLNFFSGLVGPLVSYILRIIAVRDFNESLAQSAEVIDWCLRFIPSFCLGRALFFSINVDVFELIEGEALTVWSSVLMRYDLLFLALESVVYISLAICMDTWAVTPTLLLAKIQNLISKRGELSETSSSSDTSDDDEELTDTDDIMAIDKDIISEEERVLSGNANSDFVILKKLKKRYGDTKTGKLAVDGLTLGIPAGECFGLLGINGAGKTTTMGMLTTEFAPSSGDAKLVGCSVLSSRDEVRQRIGYCPQYDSLFPLMTAQEHVELFASIRGLTNVTDIARQKLREVGLSEIDSQRISSTYSGGMKRKLSVACATIGQPQVVFLDEPSTGMDPVSRRDLWEVITKMVSGVDPTSNGMPKTAVVLTTHSMEECEALCPRIGIMAGGRLKCLGSAQHLKSRYGKGFQMELKVSDVNPTDEDFNEIISNLLEVLRKNNDSPSSSSMDQNYCVKLDMAKFLVDSLNVNKDLELVSSNKISAEDPYGYLIHKNASSDVGISLNELAEWCTQEARIQKIINFIVETYPESVVKERQDNKVRFEVERRTTADDSGLKVSELFTTIEKFKNDLRLNDYGISQTSLEQVFNQHAAEAEILKHKV